jgi:molybdopterin biosynthesis enzyme
MNKDERTRLSEIRRVVIIPTGGEVREGTVVDIDSAGIMTEMIRINPCCEVLRIAPIADREDEIARTIEKYTADADLIVITGGSGGGGRCCETLSADMTPLAMERCLDEFHASEIYGKNGHLWAKLICGRRGGSIAVNVPGPFVEASAAIKAFRTGWLGGLELEEINRNMARAVFSQYPESEACED